MRDAARRCPSSFPKLFFFVDIFLMKKKGHFFSFSFSFFILYCWCVDTHTLTNTRRVSFVFFLGGGGEGGARTDARTHRHTRNSCCNLSFFFKIIFLEIGLFDNIFFFPIGRRLFLFWFLAVRFFLRFSSTATFFFWLISSVKLGKTRYAVDRLIFEDVGQLQRTSSIEMDSNWNKPNSVRLNAMAPIFYFFWQRKKKEKKYFWKCKRK